MITKESANLCVTNNKKNEITVVLTVAKETIKQGHPTTVFSQMLFKKLSYAIWRTFKVLHMLSKRYYISFVCSVILGQR